MDNASVTPRPMTLHLLEEITNGFSNDRKVGAGSYGSVYKGEYKTGETIAVKLLHYIPELHDEKFMEEYLNLATLKHKNVVRLVGYCNETRREIQPFNGKIVLAEVTKRALCFEYMHNGSLDQYLSDEFTGHDWCTRYAIIKGICQGLKYLHEELQSPMYHLDIKPGNVLLDENKDPKLADFGLSRLFGGEKTKVTKSAIGTQGYVPPEYIDAGIISNKFDVFSLGVVFIKIMTGPTGYYRSEEMSSQEYIDLVHANWMKRLYKASVHQLDSYSKQVKRCIEIALSCLHNNRHERPSIGQIVSKLNETETMYKICPCISNKCELVDISLPKLISYPLHVTDSKGRLHETIFSTICQREDDTTSEKQIQPKMKIINSASPMDNATAIDVHPMEPWILVGHYIRSASIWNHQTQERLMAFEFNHPIWAVRFIAQKQWFIAGDDNGLIHVYKYTTKDKLTEFDAHTERVTSLAVHPTDPFVLSSSGDKLIKLWNWENGWECVRIFRAHTSDVTSVKFNPLAASNTFASASWDRTVKIWNMFSDTPIMTLECGTDRCVWSADYFIVRGNREFIVAGTLDGTADVSHLHYSALSHADLEKQTSYENIHSLLQVILLVPFIHKIWDLETKTCIRHVEGLQEYEACIAVVDCHPGDPILVTVSQNQIISFCNSTTHRYQNMIDFKLGPIRSFAYIKDTKSLVVAGYGGGRIAIMEIS